MYIEMSTAIRKKLRDKHDVSEKEIRQCFLNRQKHFLEDEREEHKTVPPTQWFISLTNKQRELKILFVNENGKIHVKSAFEPNDKERWVYNCNAR